MFRILSFIACLLILIAPASSQKTNRIASSLQERMDQFESVGIDGLISLSPDQLKKKKSVLKELSDATFFKINEKSLGILTSTSPEILELELPISDNTLQLQLYKTNIFSSNFKVTVASNRDQIFPYTAGLYYWGIVKNDNESLVALSISGNDILFCKNNE